ncbi:hypothetical protein G3580_10180 [Nitrogeniibacter mangrovi]|uniref:Uncharacterized protein n=1 Tax=Nitrogeniibacter mangrovi TaxID=2016596 RepID=A0A6C1B533_9RHOO|nr:hypothetical protein [Nitrogeniibacter mangrovi]QID17975.1 hypothetical protein G3580_10180 [Nitrogeniibacter mangrovi]
MRIDPEQMRFFNGFGRRRAQPMGPWQKIVAGIVGAGVFVLALMFSVVLFAAVVTIGLLVWGYVWWKTRAVRRQMRDNPPDGLVIEGEIIREGRPEDVSDETPPPRR